MEAGENVLYNMLEKYVYFDLEVFAEKPKKTFYDVNSKDDFLNHCMESTENLLNNLLNPPTNLSSDKTEEDCSMNN